MSSIRIRSPRELELPKSVQFWCPRINKRDFRIHHIVVSTAPNPDVVEVRLFDSEDGDVKEAWYAYFGCGVIRRVFDLPVDPKPRRRMQKMTAPSKPRKAKGFFT